MRETGRPVEGHVEAANPDEALKALSDNAIVTESLTPDPKPLNLNEELPDAPDLANALDSAFDASSAQVAFDDLTERYKGKKVWVIDRDKIRRRVCQVVDQAMAQSAATGEGAVQSRQRVQAAIQGMFADNRNIATERNADTIHGAPGYQPPAPPKRVAPPPPVQQVIHPPPSFGAGLEDTIGRLAAVVASAEKVMASLALAARNMGRGGGGGGGGGGRRRIVHGANRAQNEVLLEIFKANLDLAKAMSGVGVASANGGALPAPEPVPVESTPAEGGGGLEPVAVDAGVEPINFDSTGHEPVGASPEDDSTPVT
jgi:hypothetical protein